MSAAVVALALALSLAAFAAGCSKSHGETEGGGAGEKPHDFIRYDPNHAPHDFIKIETVQEVSGATSISLPGRVSFDEDHTQRVASPIDGRAVTILVKAGDRVRAGQPLLQLSSPSVGQIQADAQKALSDLSVSEKATERVHKLQAEGAVAEKEVAQSEGELRKARSDHARATAQLKALGVSPSDPGGERRAARADRGRRRRAQRAGRAGGARRSGDAAADDIQPGHGLGAGGRLRAGPGPGGGGRHRSRSRSPPIRARSSPAGSGTSATSSIPPPVRSRSAASSRTRITG